MPEPIEQLIQHDVELMPYNTMKISARARSFAFVSSVDELTRLLEWARKEEQNVLVLGGGSNILLTEDYNGLVLLMDIKGREVAKQNAQHIWLRIGAGENWHQTVRYAVEKGWGGIENLSLIPGRAGAAPIQNIGAYGVELADIFESLQAIDIRTGNERIFRQEECRFGYRDSIFKHKLKGKYIITRLTLRLDKNPKINTSYGAISKELNKRGISDPGIQDISDIVIDIRNSKLPDPVKIPNTGSFFKNPIIRTTEYDRLVQQFPHIPGYSVSTGKTKVPAGWLIEEAGWKGKRKGSTGTYRQQALVIVNYGGATADEILELAAEIKSSVKEQFGIELVPEVNII